MPTPATGTALPILVIFVLSGFVAVLLKERICDVRGEEATFDRLLTTVYYSLLVYLLPALVVGVLSAPGALDHDDIVSFLTVTSSWRSVGSSARMGRSSSGVRPTTSASMSRLNISSPSSTMLCLMSSAKNSQPGKSLARPRRGRHREERASAVDSGPSRIASQPGPWPSASRSTSSETRRQAASAAGGASAVEFGSQGDRRASTPGRNPKPTGPVNIGAPVSGPSKPPPRDKTGL